MAQQVNVRVQVYFLPGLRFAIKACGAVGWHGGACWCLSNWPSWVKVGRGRWERVH